MIRVPALNTLSKFTLLLLAIFASLSSSQASWFAVPLAQQVTAAELVTCETGLQLVFRTGCIFFACSFALCQLPQCRRRSLDTCLAGLWLGGALAFPALLLTIEPEIASRAAWLQGRFDHLVWLGGDISVGFEATANGRANRFLIVDPPLEFRSTSSPTWSPGEFGLTRLPHLVEWAGWSNTFCQFYGRGWVLGVAGGACGVLASMICVESGLNLRIVLASSITCALVLLAAMHSWIGAFAAGSELSRARLKVAKGALDQAIEHLTAAANAYPMIKEGSAYTQQLALLNARHADQSHSGRLGVALMHEHAGRRLQAGDIYRSLMNGLPSDHPIARVAREGVLRGSVYQLNRGHDQGARADVDLVLAHEACDLKALLVGQVATQRLLQVDDTNDYAERMTSICKGLRFSNKKIVLADAQRRLCVTESEAGKITEAWRRLPLTRTPL